MPGMDGYAVLAELQSGLATCDIAVIAITENAMKSDIERGKAVGFSDYLSKPLDVKQFHETINRYLSDSREGTP